jgi:hypothetical protein
MIGIALPPMSGTRYRGSSYVIPKSELTWATVNTDDSREMADFDELEEQKAGERIKIAFNRLRDLGLVDANGELLSPELPADMRPLAKRDSSPRADISGKSGPLNIENGPIQRD